MSIPPPPCWSIPINILLFPYCRDRYVICYCAERHLKETDRIKGHSVKTHWFNGIYLTLFFYQILNMQRNLSQRWLWTGGTCFMVWEKALVVLDGLLIIFQQLKCIRRSSVYFSDPNGEKIHTVPYLILSVCGGFLTCSWNSEMYTISWIRVCFDIFT